MGFFFERRKKNKRKEREQEQQDFINAGLIDKTINQAAEEAAVKFAKPEIYDRSSIENVKAMRDAKFKLFKNGKVVDPYTDKELLLKKVDAKTQYGEEWQDHLAESDHIKPLNKFHSETKDNPWLTNKEIKKIGNSKENIRVTNRTFNNAKRDRDNKEFVTDDEYIKDKDVRLTQLGKKHAIKDGKKADRFLKRKTASASAKNVLNTTHNAGMQAAVEVGEISGMISLIHNVVSIVKEEKTPDEAIADTIRDGGKSAVYAYATTSLATATKQTFAKTFSKVPSAFAGSPLQVINAVKMMGRTFIRYADGEITTAECMYELGEKGASTAAVSYSMGVGQTFIPIPIVGAAIGAVVGFALTSAFAQKLRESLQGSQIEHQKRLMIMAECERAIKAEREYRAELETIVSAYFEDHMQVFMEALDEIHTGFQSGDADAVVSGANMITRKLGGQVQYETVSEFKEFLEDDTQVFIL